MRVVFVPSNVSGVMFYRMWQPYLALKRLFKKDEYAVTWYAKDCYDMHRWEADLYDDKGAQHLYQTLDAAVRWADVVVWMGLHTPRSVDLFLHLKAKHGKRFVTEMDDFVFSIPRYNIASIPYQPGSEMTQTALRQIRESDALIVSTPYLASKYAAFNNRVYVIENTINLSLWRKPSRPTGKERQGVKIGWMGGGRTMRTMCPYSPQSLKHLKSVPI